MEKLRTASPKMLMQGLGEVIDNKTKVFVRSKLIEETATALELFAAIPLIVVEESGDQLTIDN